jgi:hypothetical protein
MATENHQLEDPQSSSMTTEDYNKSVLVDRGYDNEKVHDEEYETTAVEKQPDQMLAARHTALGSLYRRLFSMGVEARGVERVPEDERSPKNAINNLLMWFSVNTGIFVISVCRNERSLCVLLTDFVLRDSAYHYPYRCFGTVLFQLESSDNHSHNHVFLRFWLSYHCVYCYLGSANGYVFGHYYHVHCEKANGCL